MSCIYCRVQYILENEIQLGRAPRAATRHVLFFLENWAEVLQENVNDTVHGDSKLIGIKDKTKLVLRRDTVTISRRLKKIRPG